MMYKRRDYITILERLKEPRQFLQVVMGPRQVGKSTVVTQVLGDLGQPYLYYTADGVPASDSHWISVRWDEARIQMKAGRHDQMVLALDEVQKIRNWSECVKKEWDADTRTGLQLKVVLLGSSRVMLAKGLSESLFGRFEEIRIGHWTYPEMRDAFGFSLEQFIYFGGYPGATKLVKNEGRWRDYIHSAVIEATINKDILMDTPVSKPALLRQTFELSAAYSGKILSLTKMLGQLQDAGNTVTLAGYLNLLNDSGLVAALQKYAADLSRRRASVPKYQVYNNALLSVFTGTTYRAATADSRLWGQLMESAIGTHIINSAFVHRFEVYYWREGNNEVDFILRKYNKLIAIEVKSNSESSSPGLADFSNRFTPQAAFIVGRNGIAPETFLAMDLSLLFE